MRETRGVTARNRRTALERYADAASTAVHAGVAVEGGGGGGGGIRNRYYTRAGGRVEEDSVYGPRPVEDGQLAAGEGSDGASEREGGVGRQSAQSAVGRRAAAGGAAVSRWPQPAYW